jgi:hypothetical protein
MDGRGATLRSGSYSTDFSVMRRMRSRASSRRVSWSFSSTQITRGGISTKTQRAHQKNRPNSSISTPLHTINSSPSWTRDSSDQSKASLPLSSGLAAHKKTRVLRVRLYPSDFDWRVKENMDAEAFSKVSKDTFGVKWGEFGGDVGAGRGLVELKGEETVSKAVGDVGLSEGSREWDGSGGELRGVPGLEEEMERCFIADRSGTELAHSAIVVQDTIESRARQGVSTGR